MRVEIALKTDLRGYARGMADVVKRQLPFAMAQGLTATAGRVGLAWQGEMREQLDRPTPFTVGSVGVKGARKTDLSARVYVKDIAAQYLEPFVDGGPHFLGKKKGLLTPKAVPLNAYGNLSKGKLASLKAKGDVFVGPVKLKGGQVINGVWRRDGRRSRPGARNVRKVDPLRGARSLKLLIRFDDPQPVTQHLNFKGRAEAEVRKHFEAEFAKAFAHALATAK